MQHGQLYLYRLDGPYEPEQGHRFNRHKPLLDPYAKALTGGPTFNWDFSQAYGFDRESPEADLSFSTTTNLAGMPKCIVYGDDGFDWQGDRHPDIPIEESVEKAAAHTVLLSTAALGDGDEEDRRVTFRLPNGGDQEVLAPLLAENEAAALAGLQILGHQLDGGQHLAGALGGRAHEARGQRAEAGGQALAMLGVRVEQHDPGSEERGLGGQGGPQPEPWSRRHPRARRHGG